MKRYLKAIPTAIIITVIVVAIVIASEAAGFRSWPLFFLVFYHTSFGGIKLSSIAPIAGWGFLGMLGGYLEPFLGSIGTLLLLVYLVAVLGLSLSGVIKSFNPALLMMLTAATAIPCTAESFLGDVCGFAAGVLLMILLGLLTRAGEKKKQQ